MKQRLLWAVVGVLYELEASLDERDLRTARRLVSVAMRLLLSEIDDVRRARS